MENNACSKCLLYGTYCLSEGDTTRNRYTITLKGIKVTRKVDVVQGTIDQCPIQKTVSKDVRRYDVLKKAGFTK
jgi:hypothetical protein